MTLLEQAEIEMQYAKQLEALRNRFGKPRNERGAVANVTKALRYALAAMAAIACPSLLHVTPGLCPDVLVPLIAMKTLLLRSEPLSTRP